MICVNPWRLFHHRLIQFPSHPLDKSEQRFQSIFFIIWGESVLLSFARVTAVRTKAVYNLFPSYQVLVFFIMFQVSVEYFHKFLVTSSLAFLPAEITDE